MLALQTASLLDCQAPEVVFSGVARISAESIYLAQGRERERVQEPSKTIYLARGSKESFEAYVDLQELDEALELFFAGHLDEVSSERVNLPLEQLVAGKPLISQLESSDIEKALGRLPVADRFVIRAAHGLEPNIELDSWAVGHDYSDALFLLGKVVASML